MGTTVAAPTKEAPEVAASRRFPGHSASQGRIAPVESQRPEAAAAAAIEAETEPKTTSWGFS
jgi:hypothetical protein